MDTEVQIIEKIRARYVQKEITKLDQLKRLDRKVKRPVEILVYLVGILSLLVLGVGMCLAMKVIGRTLFWSMPLGIGVGLVGILLLSINYPIYKRVLKTRKNKYSKQIIELSDSLLNK